MRTAVVRINVDPRGELADSFLSEHLSTLAAAATDSGMELIGGAAASGRELQLLVSEADVPAVAPLCEQIFGTVPARGVVTYVSRGTDDDVRGVLAGFGLTGEVSRTVGDDGLDVVTVALPRAALERIPESRVHTALEASLNCEVQIVTG